MKYILIEIEDNSEYKANYRDAPMGSAPDAVIEFINPKKIHAASAYDPYKKIEKLLSNIRLLLGAIGDKAECRDSRCRRTIFWIKNNKTGKSLPITEEALNHFADCPAAKSFKEKPNGPN